MYEFSPGNKTSKIITLLEESGKVSIEGIQKCANYIAKTGDNVVMLHEVK